MSRKLIFFSVLVMIISSMLLFTLGQSQKATADKPQLIKKGEYLVMIGGCNDCHSPKIFTEHGPEFDTKRLLSGHPAGSAIAPIDMKMVGPGKWTLTNDHLTGWVGPWGMSFAANLTPDDQTGIGLWTEDVFIKALRTGKHMGAGRPILPPMPWQNLVQASDEDLQAIFAYLKSLPAVKNAVPAPIPPTELGK
jgi:cytochrome c553